MLDHVDIPRFEALHKHWLDHPPLQWMIAAYFNIGKKSAPQNIEEANEFVPVETLKSEDFDGLLKDLGIPQEG